LITNLNWNNIFNLIILCLYKYITKAFECISVLVATRRTLFSEEERAKFIKSIMQELIKILHSPQAFNDQSNYHGNTLTY